MWSGLPESPELSLPEAPQPQNPTPVTTPTSVPCSAANGAKPTPATAGTSSVDGIAPSGANGQPAAQPAPCHPQQTINWYMRFTNGPQVKPMTPSEKDRKSTRLNSSHLGISYAVFC